MRYVVEDAEPFILRIGQQGGRGSYVAPVDAPVGTVVTKAEHCLVVPNLVEVNHGGAGFRGGSVGEPMLTVTGGYGQALGGAYLAQVGYGERAGQRPRAMSIEEPLGTVVAGGGKHSLVTPWLERLCGGPGGNPAKGRRLDGPAGAVTTRDQHALVAAWLTQMRGSNRGKGDIREPAPAITAGGTHVGLVLAWLMKYYGVEGNLQRCNDPLGTVTTRDRFAIVTVRLQTPGGGATVDAAAVFTRAFGWCIVLDILMRMLTPRELARAQGFPDSYILPENKSLAVRLIGNSVPPPVVAALTRANCPELCAPGPEKRTRRTQRSAEVAA